MRDMDLTHAHARLHIRAHVLYMTHGDPGILPDDQAFCQIHYGLWIMPNGATRSHEALWIRGLEGSGIMPGRYHGKRYAGDAGAIGMGIAL